MNTNGSTTTRDTRSIPGPLRAAADMHSSWQDVELGFDEAAERIIQAHAKDGAAQDPIGDLKTYLLGVHADTSSATLRLRGGEVAAWSRAGTRPWTPRSCSLASGPRW